ncbi:hypothetical protein ACTA71_009268 [Dictyostelium dimigraforme]
MDRSLLFAGLSAVTGQKIVEENENVGSNANSTIIKNLNLTSLPSITNLQSITNLPNVQTNSKNDNLPFVTITNLHRMSLSSIPFGSPVIGSSIIGSSAFDNSNNYGKVYLKIVDGKTIEFPYDANMTIERFKTMIQEKEGIPKEEQIISFGGKTLESGTFSDHNIQRNSTLNLTYVHPLPIDKKHFSPEYDYDFTNIVDGNIKFSRGGHEYVRPCGWMRFALNVQESLSKDGKWLGCTNGDGEWAVSYHGTGQLESKSIAEHGYDKSKLVRDLHGKGIYSTPSVECAQLYAKVFYHNGEKYNVILQNRVNPKTVKIIPKEVAILGEYWITEEEEDIIPYGICIRKV